MRDLPLLIGFTRTAEGMWEKHGYLLGAPHLGATLSYALH